MGANMIYRAQSLGKRYPPCLMVDIYYNRWVKVKIRFNGKHERDQKQNKERRRHSEDHERDVPDLFYQDAQGKTRCRAGETVLSADET